MFYAVKLTPIERGEIMVTCPDLPELTTVGDNEVDALREALDGIESTLLLYMQERRDIPEPSAPKRGQRVVQLPPLSVAKVGLYRAMRAKGLSKAELARRLGVPRPSVDRLLDLRHLSKLEQVQGALEAIGYRIELQVLAA